MNLSEKGLLPCPFCGGDAEIVHIDEGENAGGSCVCCTSCLASGDVEFEFKENFISNWNRRAYLQAAGSEEWRSMDSAPRDGTRILIKAVTFGWSSDICQHVATGDKAVEARWSKGLGGDFTDWYEWCGNERTHSTSGRLVPLGWIPLPAIGATP